MWCSIEFFCFAITTKTIVQNVGVSKISYELVIIIFQSIMDQEFILIRKHHEVGIVIINYSHLKT